MTESKIVARDTVPDPRDETGKSKIVVSTVRLIIDHGYPPGPPLWYETMIFQADHDGKVDSFLDLYCDRYTTREEAVAGHENVLGSLARGEWIGYDNTTDTASASAS